jgi:uncharacterized protein (TIGR00251 family)
VNASVVRPGPGDRVDIDVQVVPRASRDRIGEVHDQRLKVRLAAAPVEGAANRRLVELLARTLEIPRANVDLVRGRNGRRKTVRIAGLDIGTVLARLGLSVLAACFVSACEPITSELWVDVVLPEDASDLDATNNVSLVLAPDGFTETFVTDGLDFSLQIEVEPDDVPRDLALYLAHDEDLLAWGRTPEFLVTGGSGLALLVARPGTLSTYPGLIDSPDPGVLAAPALGRGMVVLESDGPTFVLSQYSFDLASAEPLVSPPTPDDGALVSDALGGVVRLCWSDALAGYRFDPGLDEWIDLAFDGPGIGARPDAAHLVDATHEHVLLFGGGEATDVVAVDLVPAQDGILSTAPLSDVTLDAPRRGATAAWVTRSDTDEGETVLLFGTEDTTLPTVFLTGPGEALGPFGPWIDGRCIQVDAGDDSVAAEEVRVLCAGGLRGNTPTADAVLVTLPPVGSAKRPFSELLEGFLEVAMADPIWLEDPGAVYVQGAGRLFGIDRGDLRLSEPEASPQRHRGGQSVTLETGASLVLGGVDADDGAVDRWQVFMPALEE